jgi:hypothetical protein
MIGYSTSTMDDLFDWRSFDHIGIRIPRGQNPSPELFHDGQPVVFYAAPTRTIPAHGTFTGEPYEIDPPEYGCSLAIGSEIAGYVPSLAAAPSLAAHADISVTQGSLSRP